LDARLTTLLRKEIIIKSKEVNTGCNLAESSKAIYGSKSYVFPMMIAVRILYTHDDAPA
jgi:hypothetical protein